MGLYVLELAFWMLGIRGHIPQYGDYHRLPAAPSSAGPGRRLLQARAACAAGLAGLAMMVWLAVWLTLRLL